MVMSIIGYDQEKQELYGLDHTNKYLMADNVFNNSWLQIQEKEFEAAKEKLTFATEIPVMPIIDSLVPTEPIKETVSKDSLGNHWGGKSSG